MKHSMRLIRRLQWPAVLILLIGMTPMFGTVGGCPVGGSVLLPPPPQQQPPPPPPEPPAPQPGSDPASNQPPTLRFDAPFANMTIQDGTAVQISFTASDAEDQTRVNVFADFVDNSVDPPVEGTLVLATGRVFDAGGGSDTVQWNTSGARPARYTIHATITDQINAPVTAVAAGAVTLLPRPGEPPPDGEPPPRPNLATTLRLVQPFGIAEIEQGEPLTIEWETTDFDDGVLVTLTATLRTPDSNDTETPVVLVDNRREPPDPASPPGRIRDSFTNWNSAAAPVDVGLWELTLTATEDRPIGEKNDDPPPVIFSIDVGSPGVVVENAVPDLVFIEPRANMGLSSRDVMTIRYVYSDTDNQVTVTLLLDKDRDPTNDDITNPGDPTDPNTNIILLPSEARRTTDPTFDGDPLPPDNPNNPPRQPDSLEVRTNPRVLDQTAPRILPPEVPASPIPGEFKEYIFTVDFSKIPVRSDPYFIRATVQDETHTIHRYAIGSLTVTNLASGMVDTGRLGFTLSGARFTGFNAKANLGSEIVGVPDLDGDGIDDMILVGRFASPRNRFQAGAAYLLFGRSKTPFPLDTDGDGLPDIIDGNGNVRNFPPAPPFFTNPYDSAGVGRFGGNHNINSVASFFRGMTYTMPKAHDVALPPMPLQDPNHPASASAGLTSVTQIDMTADGVRDFVFGLPFVSGAWDFADDDPDDADLAGTPPPCGGPYTGDSLPNNASCDMGVRVGRGGPNDDLYSPRWNNIDFGGDPVDEGLVIVVDGTNDLVNRFRLFTDAGLAGQFDPDGAIDDEGNARAGGDIPTGMRFRGGWFPPVPPPIATNNQYGRTVAAIPSIDNDLGDELLISSPGFDGDRGRVHIWLTANYTSTAFYEGPVLSLPSYWDAGGICPDPPDHCTRALRGTPQSTSIAGADPGDQFGFAGPAGPVNRDGPLDILAGAPGADRPSVSNPTGPNLTDNGIFYVLFTPAGGFGLTDLGTDNPPRVEIRGTHNGDRFGEVQTQIGDINGDNIGDIAFASESFDDDVNGNGSIDVDAGYVGIIFGNRPLTGENFFSPSDVGTPDLSGVRFLGPTAGALAGHDIASAGDFNGDSVDDLLIAAPGEQRDVNGQTRRGVVYLIFGGRHLIDRAFNLSQVGNPELPGIVFVSRFVVGSPDEAPLETVGGLGDIDGDGFDDIAIGAPLADFVDLASPTRRREDAGEAYIVYGNNFGSNNLGG